MYMHSALIFNADLTTIIKIKSGATIYGVGMIQPSIFNPISAMMVLM